MKVRARLLARISICLIFLLAVSFLDVFEAQAQEKNNDPLHDLEIIRERIRNELMEGEANDAVVAALMKSMKNNGSWPNINYDDVSRTGFEHSRHLSNMLTMSLAFQHPSSVHFQNKELKGTINQAIDFWLDNDFICDNWWWNQIGTPRRLVEVFLVMDEHITDSRKRKAAPVIGRAHLDAWGARPGGDRIKIAAILGKAALLNRDTTTLRKVIHTMNEEIHFAYQRGTPEDQRGLQTDLSFHHRKDRVTNTLSYGLGYAAAFAEWTSKVSGTNYRFSEEAMQLLVDYFLDGICKTTIYAKYPDPGAKNRSISRQGTLKGYSDHLPRMLLSATHYRENELTQVIKVRNGEAEPNYTFNKFFWHTEYMSHQRPDYFASVRMFSLRNHTMEQPYNGEGLLNHHLGEGANFISISGQEYFDIFPVWDWQKIPGTTVVQKPSLPSEKEIQKRGITDFVGGVTNGTYGASAFDFISPLDSTQAHKSWFFFENEFVCLGSGIHSEQPLPVVTTLNQSYLDGEVSYTSRRKSKKISAGSHRLRKVKWIYHDSVAYIFPERNSVHLLNDTVSGSWKRINRQHDTSEDLIIEEVFKLWIDHGVAPQQASYAYIVLPASSLEEAKNYYNQVPLTILSNTTQLQGVRHHQLNISQLCFYEASNLEIDKVGILRMQQPGLIMLQDNGSLVTEISVSDPSRNLNKMTFGLEGVYTTTADNVTISSDNGLTVFEVMLPGGEYAGQSVNFSVKNQRQNLSKEQTENNN